MRLKVKKMSFFILVFISLFSLSRLLAATTITVPSSTYPTIQAGIDAAQPGDTVDVALGNYTGRVVIGKNRNGVTLNNIILQGAGAGVTFLNISGTGGTAITFDNVSGSIIRGFTIKNADIGIKAVKSKANITNNIFLDNASAFENRSSYSRVINNTFYGNTKAVFTNSSSTLKNNIIAGSGRYGVAGSTGGSISYNLFHRNTIGNYSGISAPPASFNNITGNPLFVNFTTDFHLRVGSPAIDKGDPLVKDAFDNSTSDMGTCGGPSADVTPAAVAGVAGASSTSKVTISWNKNMAYNISGYKVYYGTSSGNYTLSVSAGDASSYDFTSITPNQRYYFAVTALADGNVHESLKSAEVSGAIDTLPPTAPANLKAEIGDRRLYLRWDAATDNESGVRGYKVYYGTASGSYSSPVDVGNVTSYELAGLSNGTIYYVAVSAYDYAGNEGDKSSEVNEAPQEIRGILGLKGTGGCFIATAAYGSYEERHVKVLREFRDRYLLGKFKVQSSKFKFEVPNIAGRAFVRVYYKVSPPMADFIVEHPWLKPVVRIALLPLIGFAWMLLNYPLLTLGCTGFLFIFLALTGLKTCSYETYSGLIRRNMASAMLRIFILSSLILLFPSSASFGDEGNGLSLGLTYGQLEPASDEWREIYGDDRISTYRVSLGYRFHPTISAEIGAGYLTKNGKGKTVTGGESGAETTFQSAPLDITLIYRLNYFPEQVIIPYIGGGVSYNLYWENVKDGKELKGGMWGHHATGGLQLLLDKADRRSAFDLKEDYGIEGTYLTIGATHSVIDDFGGEDVDLGGWNYNVGFLFEF